MKKKVFAILICLLCASCQNNSNSTSNDISKPSIDNNSVEESNLNLLQKYYYSSSHSIDFAINLSTTNLAHGQAKFIENGVYSSLIYQEEEMVVAYAEDTGGIFEYMIINDHVRATSPYFGDSNGNTIHGLYSLVPSIKLIDEKIINEVELQAETTIENKNAFSILLEICGLDLSNFDIQEIVASIEDNDCLRFDFICDSDLNVNLTFKELNTCKIADLAEYLSKGGSCDLTYEKVTSLMSTYNYISYLYDSNNELYAIEYYNENYYFTDYADPQTTDEGYIGIPASSEYISGIYRFVYDGKNVILDNEPMDVSSNHLKNVFTYPSDLSLLLDFVNLEYSPANDAYISTDIMHAIEVAQVFGLEEVVNILYPYCSAIQFIEDTNDINSSKVGIWYVYDYNGEIGIYAKEFTNFGASHLSFVEEFLSQFN